MAYAEKGNYDAALEYYYKAKKTISDNFKRKEHVGYACLLHNIGNTYQDKGLF